jgi:carnosine synthase
MEFIEGSEHDVDIVMFDGQTVAAFVTDNGPTRMPYFSETAAAMPSRLHR